MIPSFRAVSDECLSLAARAGRSTGGPLHPLRSRVACSPGGDHPACPPRLLLSRTDNPRKEKNMPNWTANTIDVSGKPADLRAFLEAVAWEDEIFNFHRLIPMPEILKHMGTGSRTIDGQDITA
jgi:hypothetical protein